MEHEKKHCTTLMATEEKTEESKEDNRKRVVVDDSDSIDEKYFNINDHKIENLSSLILMIEDYNEKPLPPRRKRRFSS